MSDDMVKATETQTSFRLTRDELERLQAAARAEGMTLAAWMRRAVLRVESGAVVPVPAELREELDRRAAENFRPLEFEVRALLSAALGLSVKGGAE